MLVRELTARTFQTFPDIAIDSIHFIEASMNMRERQKQALEPEVKKLGASISWGDDLTGVPECE